MTIGERIARRRKDLGLTQDELAKKMGYKSKAAISKIETNVNDITQSTVVKFAEVLDTSVAYLMGWEEEQPTVPRDFIQIFAEDPKRNEQHELLLNLFDQLPESAQEAVLVQLRALAQFQKDQGSR